MIRTDRIAVWIFIVSFALMVPSLTVLGYTDELAALLLGAVAFADAAINRHWRRYKLLWLLIAFMAFYVGYSLTAVHYNTKGAILADAAIQLKSFIPLAVFMGLRPKLTNADKSILRPIALFNATLAIIMLMSPKAVMKPILFHVMYGGITVFLSTMVYLLCSIGTNQEFTKRAKKIAALLLIGGLLCTRSKYYGECVIALFMLFVYKAGMFRKLELKHIGILCVTGLLVVIVGWSKFQYYFLGEGVVTSFDPNEIEGFARPVLYGTGALIMVDHFPFGSGLASFASFKSAAPYSGIYREYGIDRVYGLSEAMPDFICDAFYPSLAQFGVVGLIAFIILMICIYRWMLPLVRYAYPRTGLYSIGFMTLVFLLIESIAGTAMVALAGVIGMSIIGLVCGRGADIKQNENKELPQYD